MHPELLTTPALRDYTMALPERDRWVPLGVAYAPRLVMAKHRDMVCDLFGSVDLTGPAEGDTPAEVLALNEKFFCTDWHSGSNKQACWFIEPSAYLPYPALYRIPYTEWLNFHCNRRINDVPLGKLWWDHPSRRRYSRLVIVPRGETE